MTENLYSPPEANLTKPSVKGEQYDRRFNKTMVIAVSLLVITSLFFTVVSYVFLEETVDVVNEIINTLFTFALSIFIVYFIKRLRVYGLGSEEESAAKALGIWGYFWRGVVIEWFAVLVMIIIFAAGMLGGLDLTEFFISRVGTIVLGFALFPISLFGIWALFSKDRAGQLNGFFKIFRGY